MNTGKPDNNDEALRQVLQRWEVKGPLPAGFSSEVWRRIERTQRPQDQTAIHWLTNLLDHALIKPSVALTYLMALLVGGSVLGWFQAQRDKSQTHELLGQRYVQRIDPYQRTR